MVIKPISLLKESLILIGLIIGNTTTNHSVQLKTVDWRTITYNQLWNFILRQVNLFLSGSVIGSVTQATGTLNFEDDLKRGNQSGAGNSL